MLAMQRRRIQRLEAVLTPKGLPKLGFRFVVSTIAKPLNLETSRCTRWLREDGSLSEFVLLDGESEDISDDDLERFISTFPVAPG
jgi:hypothetical protein